MEVQGTRNLADLLALLHAINTPVLPMTGLRRPRSLVAVLAILTLAELTVVGSLLLLHHLHHRPSLDRMWPLLRLLPFVLALQAASVALLYAFLFVCVLEEQHLTFAITPAGVQERRRDRTRLIAWSAIQAIDETPRLLVLRLDAMNVKTWVARSAIPKRFFATPAGADAFAQALRAAHTAAHPAPTPAPLARA